MKTKLHNLYLDWVNNFLTVPRFAEYYFLTEEKAQRIIELGREIHEKKVEQYKKGLLK